MANPTGVDGKALFCRDHKNLLSGANSALSADSLKKAIQTFTDQVDSDGQPINVEPSILLVPTSLKFLAQELTQGTTLIMSGGPELAAALPLFAKLRRYTNAVVASAEKAAEYGGILYTDHPKDDTCAEIEPMDAVTLDVNQLTTIPEGWKMDELYVKAPIATYADFKKEMLSEIDAAMGIPYAIVAGTSAGYTYASAKLDHQTYFRVLRNERGFVEDSILNRLFELQFAAALAAARTRFSLPESEIAAILSESAAD